VTPGADGLPDVLRCAGAPRDLGLDQGEACAATLRSLAQALHGPPAPNALRRDLRRHFPQLAERLEGLARGARVSTRRLLRALGRELAFAGQRERAVTRAAALVGFSASRTGDGATLVWTGGAADCLWQVRESRPENGLASLEIVAPWLPGGVAGVNSAGLAIACTTLEAPAAPPPCVAPAFLLVQECLQRFENTAGAEEWCLHRPAGGRATLLIADAAGELLGVQVTGAERERLAARDGILASPDTPLHRMEIAAKAISTPGLEPSERLALLLQQLRAEALPPVSGTAPSEGVAAAFHAEKPGLWVVAGRERPRVLEVPPRSR
jgi:hypothetical protein